MEEAAGYFFFAERFHWTPDQVDAAPAWLTSRLPGVAVITDQIQRERQEAANRG